MKEMLAKLPREVQVVLGGVVLYVVLSFFDWQQVSAFGITAGVSEWHGVGVVAALLAIAVLVWELARLTQSELRLGALEPGVLSVGLVLLLLVFTVITFLTHNEARHWPAWLGLALSVVIAVAALRRARAEGVKAPGLPGRPVQH